MIDLGKICEGIHYELIPSDSENQMSWDVRLVEGDYPETVLRFGRLKVIDEHLHFDFIVVSSPDEKANEDNLDLQDFAAEILEDILTNAAANDSLIETEPADD